MSESKDGWKRRIAIGQNRDGRLEAFFITAEGNLRHNWQRTPNGLWAGEASLGKKAKAVAAAQNADGRLEVFYVNEESELLHDWQASAGGAWHGAENLGKETKSGTPTKLFASTLTAAANADGRLEVFFINREGHLQHNWQVAPNGDWHGEERLCNESTCKGGCVELSVGKNADGRLEVFYTTKEGALLHDWQTAANGDWHGAEELRPASTKATDVVVGGNADGRLEVFFRDALGTVWHDWQTEANGDWHGLESLGVKANRIAVAANRDGRLEVFYVDAQKNIRNLWQTSANGDWGTDSEVLGENATDLAVGQNQDGRLELFYWGAGVEIWHNWQPRAGQGPWNPIVRYGDDAVG